MTEDVGEEEYIFELSENPISFEPVTKFTNVFYDEVTRQVFTVRSGGATGVNVKGPDLKSPLNFRVEDKGAVLSMKFSPNQQTLAIQRSSKTVEFLNFSNCEPVGPEYSQPCRGSSLILGFVWVSVTDFIMITNQGVEHYQITAEKRAVRALKSHSLQSNWFVYCPLSGLLLVSSGVLGNCLQPYLLKNHQLVRLTKFEVDVANPPQTARLCLFERDVTPTTLYNQTVVLILKHNIVNSTAEIVIYTLSRDSPPRKTHILSLDSSGKLAVSILDNLIVVHHQASKTSSIFDINLPSESDGRCITLNPLLAAVAIRPYFFNIPASAAMLNHKSKVSCEMYSPSWVFFQPNIIIDAILGSMWCLKLVLAPVIDRIGDPCGLIDFLLRRRDCKATVLMALKKLVHPTSQSCCDLVTMGRVFDQLNECYRQQLDIEMQSQIAMPAGMQSSAVVAVLVQPNVVIDQKDLFSHVLALFVGCDDPCKDGERDRFIVATVNEYLRSLVQYHIPVQHFIYEMLIEAFVRLRLLYQLHQFFQYHAVADSKPLACLLLSLESVYPASYQLALDMLKRIGTANEEIIEILLSKNKVMSALRFARDALSVENISARKFLEAAQTSQVPEIFYGVYRFFQQRNQRARGNPDFLKGLIHHLRNPRKIIE
uniref:EOG090X028B n=1 Tax=Evadne anonyx TaxID=141404 RepID=A0A9N6WPT9_9CRUS|nr:EOG090X028B [Evadne anonyx]